MLPGVAPHIRTADRRHEWISCLAGGPFEQSIFKCQLIPVEQAVGRGFYGMWSPSAAEVDRLRNIFPQGVCDYTKPDAGLPPECM